MEKKNIMLELTIISGENLRINKTPVKKNALVVVRVESERPCAGGQATGAAREGGSYPHWKEKLLVELGPGARFLTLEVQCKGSSSGGSRPVGAVRVPVTDFLGGSFPEGYLHCLSYRLRDCHGERNGIINLSVKARLPDHMRRGIMFPGKVVTGVPAFSTYPN